MKKYFKILLITLLGFLTFSCQEDETISDEITTLKDKSFTTTSTETIQKTIYGELTDVEEITTYKVTFTSENDFTLSKTVIENGNIIKDNELEANGVISNKNGNIVSIDLTNVGETTAVKFTGSIKGEKIYLSNYSDYYKIFSLDSTVEDTSLSGKTFQENVARAVTKNVFGSDVEILNTDKYYYEFASDNTYKIYGPIIVNDEVQTEKSLIATGTYTKNSNRVYTLVQTLFADFTVNYKASIYNNQLTLDKNTEIVTLSLVK